MSGVVVLILRILLVCALYAMLGTTLWVMWRELSATSDQLAGRKIPAIRLRVHADAHESMIRTFAKAEVTLGRDPTSDVPLGDEAVSARHAVMTFHHGQWWIEDLGSRNGTRLNAQLLEGATVLAHGDEIVCGESHIGVNLRLESDESALLPSGGQDA
jgi:pSer/pThr/pTyr-binding forkhead associated (FHA) protein